MMLLSAIVKIVAMKLVIKTRHIQKKMDYIYANIVAKKGEPKRRNDF